MAILPMTAETAITARLKGRRREQRGDVR